jgi:hypothetical protein
LKSVATTPSTCIFINHHDDGTTKQQQQHNNTTTQQQQNVSHSGNFPLNTKLHFFFFMTRNNKCKLTEGCRRARWKGRLCKKCFMKQGLDGADVNKAVPKKVKLVKQHQVGEGKKLTNEYLNLSYSDVVESDMDVSAELLRLKVALLAAFDSLAERPAKPATRSLFRGVTKRAKSQLHSFSSGVMQVMMQTRAFASIFEKFKKPTCFDEMFIVSYPGVGDTRCATLHRDFLEENVYSVHFLLTPVTEDNGTVKIFLNSSVWERDPKLGTEDLVRSIERKMKMTASSVLMLGDACDVIAFDARLLHQSCPNTTEGERVMFVFTVYDSSQHKHMMNSL